MKTTLMIGFITASIAITGCNNVGHIAESEPRSSSMIEDGQTLLQGELQEQVYIDKVVNKTIYEGDNTVQKRDFFYSSATFGKAIIKNADGSCIYREKKLMDMNTHGSEKLGFVQSPEARIIDRSIDCDASIPS